MLAADRQRTHSKDTKVLTANFSYNAVAGIVNIDPIVMKSGDPVIEIPNKKKLTKPIII